LYDEWCSPDDDQAHDDVCNHVFGVFAFHYVIAARHVRDSCKDEKDCSDGGSDVFDKAVDFPHGLQNLVKRGRISATAWWDCSLSAS